tara:strand:+ start:434 stop:697 length:264 start_codon:yes stop_codon:yes gene_type:complete
VIFLWYNILIKLNKELKMAKVKSYIMDIEEKVYNLDLEKIITESENTSEAKASVFKQLNFTSSFDIGIASDVVDQCWNEYWNDYVTY